jgi:hypothetical protein
MVLKFQNSCFSRVKKEYTDLQPKINFDTRKRLVLLLPFNISRIETDSVNSTVERLKR